MSCAGNFLRCAVLLGALVAIGGGKLAHAQLRDIHYYRNEYALDAQRIDRWQRDRNVLITLTLTVGILGAATSILQAAKRQWCRMAVMAFGATITVITLVDDQFFDEDYRALKGKVRAGKEILVHYRYWLDRHDSAGTPLEKAEILRSVIEADQEFAALEKTSGGGEKPSDGTPASAAGSRAFDFARVVPEAHAGQMEQRAMKRANRDVLRFTGIGESENLAEAKLQSRDHARLAAVLYLRDQFGPASGITSDTAAADSLAMHILANGIYEGEDFEKTDEGGYRYYSQLAIDRSYLENDIQIFALQQQMVYEPRRVNEVVQSTVHPSADIVELSGNYRQDLALAKSCIDEPYFEQYREALSLAYQSDYEGAVGLLETLPPPANNYPIVWYWMARAYSALGEDSLARVARERTHMAIKSVDKPSLQKDLLKLLEDLRRAE